MTCSVLMLQLGCPLCAPKRMFQRFSYHSKLECRGYWVNGVVQGALSWGVHCAVATLMQRFGWEDGWEEQQSPWHFDRAVSWTDDESNHFHS
jgi:hypothetical protein